MGGKRVPEQEELPEPTPLPTPEAEKEPESKAVRDSRVKQLKALRGHAGTRTSTTPLSPAAKAIGGMDSALGLARSAQPYA